MLLWAFIDASCGYPNACNIFIYWCMCLEKEKHPWNSNTFMQDKQTNQKNTIKAMFTRAQRSSQKVRSTRDLLRSQSHTWVGQLASFTGLLSMDVINAGSGSPAKHVIINLNLDINFRGWKREMIILLFHPFPQRKFVFFIPVCFVSCCSTAHSCSLCFILCLLHG